LLVQFTARTGPRSSRAIWSSPSLVIRRNDSPAGTATFAVCCGSATVMAI
jgi:hypothetical protein